MDRTSWNLTHRPTLRAALESMLPDLELAYARGYILTESDLNYAVVNSLQQKLGQSQDGSRWIIGTNRPLDTFRPDVACYYVDVPFTEYFESPETFLVGVVEIKFATGIMGDLRKLARMQKRHKLLTWMVYGNHFCEQIHATYYRDHLRIEKEIHSWMASDSGRGCSILKCGQLHERSDMLDNKDVLLAYNSHWWIHDQRTIPRRLASQS